MKILITGTYLARMGDTMDFMGGGMKITKSADMQKYVIVDDDGGREAIVEGIAKLYDLTPTGFLFRTIDLKPVEVIE